MSPHSSYPPPALPAVPALPVSPVAAAVAAQTDDLGGAQAIEVAALLGDSVVGVKHCIDPRGGTVTRRTWATLAAGVACLVGAAIAFWVSVQNAAYNKGALDYWTHVLKRPSFAYRPHVLSGGLDWLAFGGFGLGLVAVGLAVARIRRERQSPVYRIGTAPGVELPVEGAPASDFPLVAPVGDDFVFQFGPGMEGEVLAGGRSASLAELVAAGHARPSPTTPGALALAIPAQAKIRAHVGQTTFVVSSVPRPRRHVAPLLAGLESRTMTYFAGSLAVHLGVVALLQQIPVDDSAAAIDIASIEDISTKTNGTEHEDVPPPDQVATDDGPGGSEGQAAAMALPEGAAGTTKSTRTDGHMRIQKRTDDIQLARQQAIEEARNYGFLGSASALNGGFQALTAQGDLSSGLDDATVYGAMFGAEGESQGTFGFGRNGFGPGGGCDGTNCGIIGTGRYGTIGMGAHAGDGWGGPGGGGPMGRKHVARVPRPVIGQPVSTGEGLDKATIRRYMKRNIEKISYCYEHELLAKPGMQGNVTVSFFITPTGSVQSSRGSGFDATVANCVAEVVGNIAFPKPNTGGGIQVNYPFTFHAAS